MAEHSQTTIERELPRLLEALDGDDMAAIEKMDRGGRTGPDPDRFHGQ